MISWKPAVLAVFLVLNANAQAAIYQDQKCDVSDATYCYWQLAWKYGGNHLIRREDVKTSFLEDICVTEDELPKVPICKQYYDGCVGSEKQNFTPQEIGYSMLQKAVTDKDTCADATVLATCISPETWDCRVFFYMTPTKSNAENNFQAAKKLRSCLKDALTTCSGGDKEYLGDYIDSIAGALTYLYWNDSSSTPSARSAPQTTFGATTQESASPTHETSSTTAQSERPTTRRNPTVTTEGSEQSTTVSTTTGKPEPATTPAPSSAFTNLPELCALCLTVLILMVWSA